MFGATVKQYVASVTSTIAVVMVGASFVWMEPLMQKFIHADSEIPMTTKDTSWLVATIELGELFCTIPASLLADKVGRKPMLLLSGPLCLISWILVLTTRSLFVLYIVRLLQGVCIAIVYTAGPMYIAEISEARIRGELSGHFQTQWYAGILLIYIIGPLFDYQTYICICGAIPLLFILTFIFMPESPYYYLMVGKNEKALKSLKWLRSSNDVGPEFDMIKRTVEQEMGQKGSWTNIFATKHDRKMFFIVQLVCAVKHLNGMPAVIAYASESVKAGTSIDPHLLTIGIGVTMCLATTFSAFVVDSFGRRSLLLWSAFGSVVFNVTLGAYFYLAQESLIDLTTYSWIMLTAMVGLCIAANVGLGPLLNTVQAEYFPSNTRAIGGGITEMFAAFITFFSLKQFQMLTDAFGVFANYWVFAACSIIGYIMFHFVLPETAGKTLGEIQNEASQTKPPKEDINMIENGGQRDANILTKL